MKQKNTIREVYRDGSGFRYFLLCILITGLSYGLYKGMLDNYLAEVVKMGEMDRGVTEFFRELPGIALVFILAAFYMLSAETLFKVGAVIMLCGMGMHALLPASKVLATLAICVYSLGEHIQLGMKSTLSLQYAKKGRSGAAQGVQNSVSQIGTLVGYLVIVGAFSLFQADGRLLSLALPDKDGLGLSARLPDGLAQGSFIHAVEQIVEGHVQRAWRERSGQHGAAAVVEEQLHPGNLKLHLGGKVENHCVSEKGQKSPVGCDLFHQQRLGGEMTFRGQAIPLETIHPCVKFVQSFH